MIEQDQARKLAEVTITRPEISLGDARELREVWRIPRRPTESELRQRVSSLPSVFGALPLYFHIELLEEARIEGWFDFEALEYREPRPAE